MRGRRSRRRTYHPGRLWGGRPEQRGHRHQSAVKSSPTQMTTGAAAVKQVLMISDQFFVSPHAHDPHAPPHACTSPCPPTCSSACPLSLPPMPTHLPSLACTPGCPPSHAHPVALPHTHATHPPLHP